MALYKSRVVHDRKADTIMQGQKRLKNGKSIAGLYVLSFLLPVVSQLVAYAFGGYFPLGDKTVLAWDLDAQYISYFSWFVRMLKGESIDSFFYSFSISFGGATIGLLGYYLLSPFNLLLLLFPIKWLPVGVELVILCKIGCCGLTMFYFLSNRFDRAGYSECLFALMYAMMGYNVTQQVNLIWLDGAILLPVVLLWIYDYVCGKLRFAFPFLVALALITGFYIAYMVMIFAALYFCAEWVIAYGLAAWKKWIRVACVLVFLLLFGLAMSAVIVLPVLGEISNVGRGGTGGIVETLQLIPEINWKSFLLPLKEMLGAYDVADLCNGLPNVFISLFGIVFFILYLLDERQPKREKASYGMLMLVMLLSFLSVGLNQVWHGFTYTLGSNFRYSFCASFIMILTAYLEYRLVREHGGKIRITLLSFGFAVCMVIWICYALARQYYGDGVSFFSVRKLMATGIAAVFAFFLTWGFIRKGNVKRSLYITTALFLIVESAINMCWSMEGFEHRGLTEYQNFYTEMSTWIQELNALNEGQFFRVEHLLRADLNDALLIGYPSITHYSSILQSEVAEYAIENNMSVNAIEHKATQYRANLVNAEDAGRLAIKYLLTDELPENMEGWKILQQGDDYYVLENTFYKELCYLENEEGNTHIEVINSGNIDVQVNVGETTKLMTSIPYRNGWTVLVDGEKCEPVVSDGLMITIPLTEGAHKVIFRYHQPNLILGICISIAAILCYMLIFKIFDGKGNVNPDEFNSKCDAFWMT